MSSEPKNRHEIAGFLRQISIISWKNLVLYKANLPGLICEVLFSCLFSSIFILQVYLAKPTYEIKHSFYDKFILEYTFIPGGSGKTIFYYPAENTVVRKIIKDAFSLLQKENVWFYWHGFYLQGRNVTHYNDLNQDDKNSLFAFISFNLTGTTLNNITNSIKYSIFTKE